MRYGPVILLSPGRSGSTLAQRLINAVDGWYMFGEHNGAFRHFVELHDALDMHAAAQRCIGNMIVEKADNLPQQWSAWASPFTSRDTRPLFAQQIRELYTKKLPDHCIWGFKEIRYTAKDALVFQDYFKDTFIIVLQRAFEDFCKSWCIVNLQGVDPEPLRARQLVLFYLGFYGQMRVASALAEQPFQFVSYEEMCARPQTLIDTIADRFGWPVSAADRGRAEETLGHQADYVSEETKRLGTVRFADFVNLATELYTAASESLE
jgi:hypothetical protein